MNMAEGNKTPADCSYTPPVFYYHYAINSKHFVQRIPDVILILLHSSQLLGCNCNALTERREAESAYTRSYYITLITSGEVLYLGDAPEQFKSRYV